MFFSPILITTDNINSSITPLTRRSRELSVPYEVKYKIFLAFVKDLKMMKNGIKKYSLAPGTVLVYSSYCSRIAVLHTVGTLNVTWNGRKPNFREGWGVWGMLLSTHRIIAHTPENYVGVFCNNLKLMFQCQINTTTLV